MFLLQRRRVTTWASSARPAAAKASQARAAAATPQVRVVDEPAVCQSLGEGVYELPAMLPRAACARVVAEVSARVSNGSATDRGASLKTTDVYVRDLADAEDVYRALDAGCHLVELCTGRLVTYERKKAFVITYDATSTKVNGRGLTKHKDRTENRTSQANTLLITLDCRDAYGGGGTKFYPPAAKKQPFVVCGGGVTFSPDVEHEGVALTRGARRVVAVFTDECSKKAAPERYAAREAQRLAALQVFGRLKPPSRTTP